MNTLQVRSREREEMIDITREVRSVIESHEVRDALIHVFCPHTTAGLTINENADPDVQRDILHALRTLIPREFDFRHFEENSDAHLKASLVGASVTVPVSEGQLALGRWQGIYLCEFDGPRNRQVVVSIH